IRLDETGIDGTGTPFEDNRNDTDWSPMLGVVFNPAEDQSLYASASQSFAPPSIRVSDPDPQPEEGTQYEVGYKVEALRGRLQTTVAVYQLDRENIPVPDANGFTQQSGDQRSRGVEWDFAIEPIPGLRVFANYAYTDAEFTSFFQTAVVGTDFLGRPIYGTVDRTGNQPAYVPEHLGNLWVSQRFNNGVGYGVGGRYVGEQFIAEDNTFALDDYVLVDAALFFRFGRYEIQINGKNLTEEEFFTRGFYDARTGAEGSVIPGPGRTFYGTLQMQF
ncbi:MAG: TonB-dependent receptor, partial [Acidobacteriota bacterium]